MGKEIMIAFGVKAAWLEPDAREGSATGDFSRKEAWARLSAGDRDERLELPGKPLSQPVAKTSPNHKLSSGKPRRKGRTLEGELTGTDGV